MKRESIIQGFPIYLALIFVILISGCVVGPAVQTYSGYKLQKSEVAVIKGKWSTALIAQESIEIYEVDGNPVGATQVEVLPGRHKLVIKSLNEEFFKLEPNLPEWALVDCNFEAGHEYKIKVWSIRVKGIKIIDVTTGATILIQPWIYWN